MWSVALQNNIGGHAKIAVQIRAAYSTFGNIIKRALKMFVY